ncbi:SH3 domain-containing protein [Streptomyces cinnamoneus]|uniref:SH3 domain-containing protein n=1 Tax=Streptomyces cinnamoneus TaxID=53446 RepID=UPI0034437358
MIKKRGSAVYQIGDRVKLTRAVTVGGGLGTLNGSGTMMLDEGVAGKVVLRVPEWADNNERSKWEAGHPTTFEDLQEDPYAFMGLTKKLIEDLRHRHPSRNGEIPPQDLEYRVRFDNGFVLQWLTEDKLVFETGGSGRSPQPEAGPAEVTPVEEYGQDVTINEEPRNNAKRIGLLRMGETVPVLDEANGERVDAPNRSGWTWLKVSIDDQEGYVPSVLVDLV